MLGTPPTVMRTANANAALAGPICDAIRVTSWLPMNVCGTKESRNALCRFKFQSSSKKFSVSSACWIDFHSSYCVIESIVDSSMMRG